MNKKWICYGLLMAAWVLGLDQYSKYYLLEVVGMNARPPIIVTDFFNLVMVWNHGVSFGMFAEHRMPLVLIGVAAVMIVVLLVWLTRAESLKIVLAVGCIIGGAAGNAIDRTRFGAVADFFDVHIGGYHWPAFNIADSAIFIGVVVLCYLSMLSPPKHIS
jgi:signal peptidase II